MIWYTPLQITICVWFLYSILGAAYVVHLPLVWLLKMPSSFLGMGVLIASIPIPSLIGTILARVNKERMERTDARVQAMTECTSLESSVSITHSSRHECIANDQAIRLGTQSQTQGR